DNMTNRGVDGLGTAPCSTAVPHSEGDTKASKTPGTPTGSCTSIKMTPNGATSNEASYPTPVSTSGPLRNDSSPMPLADTPNPVAGTNNTALTARSNFSPVPPPTILPDAYTQPQEEELQCLQLLQQAQQGRQQWEQEQHEQQQKAHQMHQLQQLASLFLRGKKVPQSAEQQIQDLLQQLRPQIMHPPSSSFVPNQQAANPQASSSSSKPTTAIPVRNPFPSRSSIPYFPKHLKLNKTTPLKNLEPGVHVRSLDLHDSYRVRLHNLHFQQAFRTDPHHALLLQDEFKTRLELQRLLPDHRPPKRFVTMREVQRGPLNTYEWEAEMELQRKKRLQEMRQALPLYWAQGQAQGQAGAGGGTGAGGSVVGGHGGGGAFQFQAQAQAGGSADAKGHGRGGKKMEAARAGVRAAAAMVAAAAAAREARIPVEGINGSKSNKRKADAETEATQARPQKRSRREKTGEADKAQESQSAGESHKAGESENRYRRSTTS
ncbi:hypothetical protein QBC32DRAFT_221881, partial [Pseudoneurospora amorphoporcata]